MPKEWVTTALGELVKIYGGVSPANVGIVPDGRIPFVKVDDLNNCQKYQTVAREYASGDVPIVPVGSVGGAIMTNKVRISRVPIAIDTNMMALQPKRNRLDAEFLFYFVAFQQLARIADVSSVPQINNKHINPYPIELPLLSEQVRIAKILRTWDEAIEIRRTLVIKKTKRLSWFRSELLTGRRRLPGYSGKWSEIHLRELLTEHGLKSSGTEQVFSVSVHKGLVNQIEHLGRSFSAKETGHYNRVKPGDVVYTKSPTGEFPFGIIKQSKIENDVIVSPLYGVFTPATSYLGVILDAFFEAPENTTNYLGPLIQKGAKNTISITNKRFLEGCLSLPMEVSEQATLADLISTAKAEISLLKKETESLQRQLRGLMQKLLTGEWRAPLRDVDVDVSTLATEEAAT